MVSRPRQQRTRTSAASTTLSAMTFCLLQQIGCCNLLMLYCVIMVCAVWSVWKLASSVDDRSLEAVLAPPIVRTKEQDTPQQYYFHRMRPDRSGAVIQDMLLAHAFAFAENRTYGGACPNIDDGSHDNAAAVMQHQEMLQVLGLQHVLPYACPATKTTVGIAADDDEPDAVVLDDLHTKRSAQRLWSPEWLEVIRSKAVAQTTASSNNDIVVHIRRGDVSVCDATTRDRYLPNAHYLHLIEEILARGRNKTASVVIFSENNTSATNQEEEWSDFATVSPAFRFDTSPADAWRAMLQARVLILSKSSFSIVPALFNVHGTIVYTPFWVPPLPSWSVVDDATDRQAKRTNIRLQQTLCDG